MNNEINPSTTTAPPLRGPLLAIDSSGLAARVALVSPEGVQLGGGATPGDRHSASLLPLCDEVLRSAGVRPRGLGGLACGAGPGSFTGLRVGLAVAKGLALPFDLPLVLVSSLQALALDLARAAPASLYAPCIDAGKGEVYGQLYRGPADQLTAIGPEQRLTPAAYAAQVAELGSSLLTGGTGVDRHAALFREVLGAAVHADFPGPSAQAVAYLGLLRLARGERDALESAVPSYGRPPDITKPKRPTDR
jgi:tRNA threonylcarbamoyladenosine biosynthesis protein TsaB